MCIRDSPPSLLPSLRSALRRAQTRWRSSSRTRATSPTSIASLTAVASRNKSVSSFAFLCAAGTATHPQTAPVCSGRVSSGA
eukprot:2007143-Rhodomonas_salina.1